MAELKNNYSGVDFDRYKRDGDRFSTAVATVNTLYAPQKGKKIKVKY